MEDIFDLSSGSWILVHEYGKTDNPFFDKYSITSLISLVVSLIVCEYFWSVFFCFVVLFYMNNGV